MRHCCPREGKDESRAKDDGVGVTQNARSPRLLFYHWCHVFRVEG